MFSTPVRWTLRVLAWVAFLAAANLAWHAVTGKAVPGCGVGDNSGCDLVLGSTWSRWLGVPVAVFGLACYAGLAGLSVLLGVRAARPARWINTAFVLLAVLAAGASMWFLALQVFAIGDFCPWCMVADVSGIALGALAVGSTARWLRETRHLRRVQGPQAGLMTLRSALPAPVGVRPPAASGAGTVSPAASVRREWPTPSLPIAFGGAGAVLLALIAGQLVFPGKTYEVQQLALEESISLENPGLNGAGYEPQETRDDQQASRSAPRVAMRVPTEDEGTRLEPSSDEDSSAAESADQQRAESSPSEQQTASDGETPVEEVKVDPAPERRERLVTFLGGKLTLDMYQHPVIGSREAPHVLVEMVSYNCIHCRKAHRLVKQALARYGSEQVAVIVMVIPLERSCNKLITNPAASNPGACSTARMVLGLAALQPAAFPRFHDWLMADKEKPPPRDQIVARAYSLVDSSRLRELSSGEALNKQIEQYVDLFATLSRHRGKDFGLPVQILGDHILSGTIEKPEELYKAWEEHLGVKPR